MSTSRKENPESESSSVQKNEYIKVTRMIVQKDMYQDLNYIVYRKTS